MQRFAAVATRELIRNPKESETKWARRNRCLAADQTSARISMADLLAALLRDGHTIPNIVSAFEQMVRIRGGGRIHERHYRRVWGYLPPK